MDTEQLQKLFQDRNITKVKVGGFDLDGVLRGKYMSLDKFWSSAESGFGFCDVIFGWDVADAVYDNGKVTSAATGFPDAQARMDLGTVRFPPNEPDTAHVLVDFYLDSKRVHPACPRNLLKRTIARAETSGYKPYFGAEFEFWVFQEDPDSLHDKGFRDLRPVTPGMFGYSWVRTGQNKEFVHDVLDVMRDYDIEIESLHTETGPGVFEVALKYTDALEAADRAALFKTSMKELSTRHGLMVTFMAKWNTDLPGSSGHLHQSLWDSTREENLFSDPADKDGLSALARSYIGGLVKLMPELTALYSPLVNTYKRYVPGVWAPMTASWGLENRTCGVRVIKGDKPSGTRIEYRQPAADMNPYIAIATCLGAGMYGITHQVELPAATTGDATDQGAPLPKTLAEATRLLSESEAAREILGTDFIDHYVRTREWESRQYNRSVTDWELRRYFEAV